MYLPGQEVSRVGVDCEPRVLRDASKRPAKGACGPMLFPPAVTPRTLHLRVLGHSFVQRVID